MNKILIVGLLSILIGCRNDSHNENPCDGEEEGDSRAEGSSSQVSRPGWGVTGLMQRYDPNDSKSAKFEVKVSTSKTTREESKTAGKEESKVESSDLGAGSEDEVESDKSNESFVSANASSSSEDSKDEGEDDGGQDMMCEQQQEEYEQREVPNEMKIQL